MKRIFYSVALLAATMIGFTSCEEEEAKTDFRDEAIGDYDVTLSQNYAIGHKLYSMESVFEATGIKCPDLSKSFTATLSKNGDGLKLTATSVFSDEWTFVKLAEGTNGFTFEIEEYETEIDDAGTKAKFSNYLGYKLGDVEYNGGYLRGKLEFFLKDNGEFKKAIWEPVTNDAETLAAFQERIKGSQVETILTEGEIVLEVTCTKK